jgi:hypothetical protein
VAAKEKCFDVSNFNLKECNPSEPHLQLFASLFKSHLQAFDGLLKYQLRASATTTFRCFPQAFVFAPASLCLRCLTMCSVGFLMVVHDFVQQLV